jgi:hypothetical protein
MGTFVDPDTGTDCLFHELEYRKSQIVECVLLAPELFRYLNVLSNHFYGLLRCLTKCLL